MEGVSTARVDLHRLRLLLDRASAMIENSPQKEQLWQAAGDLIMGIPSKLHDLEVSLDRTSYAMVMMGENFLRGRIPLQDRTRVDDGMKSHPMVQKESLVARVARRHLASGAPSAESHFFDGPRNREVREFALSSAITNLPDAAGVAIRYMDNADETPRQSIRDSKNAPPPPLKIREAPGGESFSTLNRYLVETEQPGNEGVPKGRDDIPKHPILKTKNNP